MKTLLICLKTIFKRNSLLFLLIVLLAVLLVSCGKKGPPTLKSYEKPTAPSSLSAMHREGNIMFFWSFPRDKEESITGFTILRSSDSEFEKIASLEGGARSFVDADFREGMRYRYKIATTSLKGVTNDSPIFILTPITPPGPPQGVTFRVKDDYLFLSWDNMGSGVFYNVYKSRVKGTYGLTPANKVPLQDNSFRDVFDSNKQFYYTIRGLTNSPVRDEGPSSEEVSVNPLEFTPSPPRNIRYLAAEDRVYLFWESPDEGWIRGFRVYRRTGNEDFNLIGETQTPSFLDMDKPVSKRDYRITAAGPGKESPPAEIQGVVFIPER